ncbi:MAG: hypothetical protein EZS26_000122 [Candidatus Ordinivivax streblomastigis]|jgi:hypothetical protein|nr:MAG: hypothetical protein EZS26_001101 [Candidatus Ordinivivax streblomastigis]KAA6303571.1 MAG: hypothetical protein EZS26_000122 [Candidatus Ordinivivax streblomastigis]
MLDKNCRIVIARAKPEANQKEYTQTILDCFAPLAKTSKEI